MASRLFLDERPENREIVSEAAETANPSADRWLTPGGIPVSFRVEPFLSGAKPPIRATSGCIRNMHG